MRIRSLDTFRQNRADEGTWFAVFEMLAHAGICEEHSYEFVEIVCDDLGRRTIELMNDEAVYDMVEGGILGIKEYSVY